MRLLKKRSFIYVSLVLIGILLGSTLFNLAESKAFWNDDAEKEKVEEKVERVVVPQEEAVKRAVKKVGPSVVSIVTRDVEVVRDFFFEAVPREQKGLGSGVIIDKKGYILTNNHVIDDVDKIKVQLSDGRDFEGELVGSDPINDLAVIKIDGDDLPVAVLGDSDKLEVGQLAIAIGSPYDIEFSNTVTTGVVSALGREISTSSGRGETLGDLIQTDASINPGNSGGPLLNSQGEVIGINTAIIGNAQGIGFAIPINKAKEIIDELIEHGRVKRPWLGISGYEINQELSDYYNLPVDYGILVMQIVMDSAADKAGLEQGDIILEVDRKKIKKMETLQKIIKDKGINAKLKLLVMNSEGELKTTTATLKERKLK